MADGQSTERGELALGKDVLVAFMPWRRYNRIIDLWSEITDKVSNAMLDEIEKSERKVGDKTYTGIFHPLYIPQRHS